MHGRINGFRSLGILLATAGLALVSACGGQATTATPAASPSAAAPAGSAAPSSSAAASPTASGAPALAAVFPDVASPNCTPAPSSPDFATSSGVRAVEHYNCDFSSVVPGASANFAEWASVADAQAWFQDTVNLGPSIDAASWTNNGVVQGPLWTAANPNGVTISTGLYEGLPYTWEIRTATLDESNAVYGQLTPFAPRSELGG